MGSIVYRKGDRQSVVWTLVAWVCLLGAALFVAHQAMSRQAVEDSRAKQLAEECMPAGLVLGAEVRIKGDSRTGSVVAFYSNGVRVRVGVENSFWTGPYVYRTFGPEQLEVLQSGGGE